MAERFTSPRSELNALDARAVDEIRAALLGGGYTTAGIERALGHTALADDVSGARDDLRKLGESPLGTLLRLFFYELEVPREAAERAGVPEVLLAERGDAVAGTLRVEPFDGLLFACDRYAEAQPGQTRPDYVPGIQPTSLALARTTVRRPVRAALDVGTGCGVQALLAARHSEHVVAVDLNPRALELASLNARLNRIENVEFRLGNLFEPVEDMRFDLVVSNPPCVISPDAAYVFRDSGLPGDAVSRETVRLATTALNDGGFAHVMASWGIRDGDEWTAGLEEWTAGSTCDAWWFLVHLESVSAHAAAWNQEFVGARSRAYAPAVERWLDYYDELGFASIARGGVVLRRRDGARTWWWADAVHGGVERISAADVVEVFERRDYLSTLGDEQLLEQALAANEHHHLEQTLRLEDGEYEPARILLCRDEGLATRISTDAFMVSIVARCDGRRSVREVIERLAAELGLDARDVLPGTAPAVRRLVELGFLVPPS